MAHATNLLARIYDEINRDGVEWLMSPVKNYQLYLKKYENKSPRFYGRANPSQGSFYEASFGFWNRF
jgi:hypothetical protein